MNKQQIEQSFSRMWTSRNSIIFNATQMWRLWQRMLNVFDMNLFFHDNELTLEGDITSMFAIFPQAA